MAAGAATKKSLIGYVVPFGIPEVVRHINAFALGAQAAPRGQGEAVWTNAWSRTRRRSAAAESLICGGCRRARAERRHPGGGAIAEEKGVPWVGYDSDASKFAPKHVG